MIKATIKIENGNQYFLLNYTDDEQKLISEKLKKLGLKKTMTKNAWNNKVSLEYFREKNAELKKFIASVLNTSVYRIPFFDNINDVLFKNKKVNLAIFRVIPINNIVKIQLNKFITIGELNQMMSALTLAYNSLFELLTDTLEIDIKVVK